MIQFSLGHRVFLDLRQDIDRKEGEGKKFQSIESCVEESYVRTCYAFIIGNGSDTYILILMPFAIS